jgi:type II secretory pathway component PulM
VNGEVTALAEPITFEVKALGEGALPSKPSEDIVAFRNVYQLFRQDLMATNTSLSKNLDLVKAMKRALDQAERPTPQLRSRIVQAEEDLQAMDKVMNGSTAKNEIGERNDPSPQDGVFMGMLALSNTYGPTENQQQAFNRANGQLASLKANLRKVIETTIPELEKALKDAGAPWIEGQGILK